MKNTQPPFQITSKIIDDVTEIFELTGKLSAHDHPSSNPNLSRTNRICTNHGSLVIKQTTLSLEQLTAILYDKHIWDPTKDIAGVKNAYVRNERLDKLDPYSVDNPLTTHGIMTYELSVRCRVFLQLRPIGFLRDWCRMVNSSNLR